ncbi:MAG: hypothetical protein D6736_20495 [Nitrospinota bacterium]|nr:MAG: hypothetical protein D6736_20495 [Nitrospinota bacterium]
MRPTVHVTTAGILTVVMARFVPVAEALGFFLASSLLDVDHFVYYAARFREMSLRKAMAYFESVMNVPRPCVCVCHTLEFVVGLGLLTLASSSRLLVACLAGVVVHLALDLGEAIAMDRLSYRWWSLLEYGWQMRKQCSIHCSRQS